MSRARGTLIAALAVINLASCGGGDGGTVPVVVTPVLATVTITAPAGTLITKGTAQLTAVTLDQSAKAIAANVSWSSGATGIATVSGTGVVLGVAPGTATITATATAGGVTVSANTVVTVVAGVTSVTVTPATLPLSVGGTATLTAAVVADPRAANTVGWTTSNAAAATVSQAGLVTAVGVGTAQVCAVSTHDAQKQGCAAVTVTASTGTVASVTVTPASPSVTVGQTVQLTATVNASGGAPTSVSWASADVSKVTVNATGLATGVAATGATQVCATSTFDASKSGCATLVVTAPSFPSTATISAPGLTFNPPQVDIALGGTVTFVFDVITHNVNFGATAGAPANVPNTTSASVSRQFNSAGTFNFQCTLHAGMTGAVVVH